MTPIIGSSFFWMWPNDSQNWTLFVSEYDSRNWTWPFFQKKTRIENLFSKRMDLFLHDLKNWTSFSGMCLKELNFFSYDLTNSTLFFEKKKDSKNLTFPGMWLKELSHFSKFDKEVNLLFFMTQRIELFGMWIKELNPFPQKKKTQRI